MSFEVMYYKQSEICEWCETKHGWNDLCDVCRAAPCCCRCWEGRGDILGIYDYDPEELEPRVERL